MGKQAKVDVIINNEQARSRLAEITKDLNEVKKMRDKAFAEGDVKGFNQLNTEYKKLTTEAGKFAKQSFDVNAVMKNLSGASIRELNTAYKQTNEELKNLKRNDPGFAEKQKQVKSLKDEIDKTTSSTRQHQTATQKLSGYFKNLLPALGVTAVLGFFVNLGKQLFSVQEKFQTFTAVLKTALGSKGAAASSLQMIQDFAAKTPFSVEGLTASFIKLVNRGFKPTKDELTKLGDIASSTGKDFDMLVEAILDAETGEFERLKEFGIKASKEGDKVTFTFKGVKTTVDNTAESIRSYILSIGEMNGVMGSMAAISDTLAGKTSNLGDSWTTLLKTLGDGNEGIFSSVISGLTNIINKATWAAKSLRQIKTESEINNASDNVKESFHEIEIMTASLVRNGISLSEAKKKAYELFEAERKKELSGLERDIATTDAKLKVYTQGISGFKAERVTKDLFAQKESFETRKRMLEDEMDQIKAIKAAEIDYSTELPKYKETVINEIEKEIGAYADLVTQIGDLEEQFRNLKASDQPIPNDLIHQIISKKGELKEIEESVKAIGEGIALMSMKQAGVIIPGIPTQPGAILQKRNIDISTGAPEGTEKGLDLGFEGMSPEDKKAFAIAQAQTTSNALFDIVKSRQQAEYDHKMSLLEKEKTAELSNKNLTEAQKAAIEKKYQDKERKLKTEAFQKEKAAAIIQAVINTALAIMNALATGGPAAPALAIAAGITGAAQIAVIAAQKPPEFYEGGFTDSNINDKKPVGIVHANEFIGSADAVRNPSIKRYFDVIDYAQRNGTINQINLQEINVPGKKEYRSGGYSTRTMIEPTQISQPGSAASNQLSNEALSITREIAKQIALEFKDGIRGKWVLSELEKIQEDNAEIKSATRL